MKRPSKLRFVTGNDGKVKELQAALEGLGIEVVQDARGYDEIQADTLHEVADAGARRLLADGLEPPFVLEDAGLFIQALHGFPGVYSRYAYDTIGCQGVVDLMRTASDRSAAFRACLTYVDVGIHHFEGACRGTISDAPAGDQGFGFDPIFIPEGHGATFAQMDLAAKGEISHRGRATARFASWLAKQ